MKMGNIAETISGKHTPPQGPIAAVFALDHSPLSKSQGARCALILWRSQNFERLYGTYTEYLYNTPWEG